LHSQHRRNRAGPCARSPRPCAASVPTAHKRPGAPGVLLTTLRWSARRRRLPEPPLARGPKGRAREKKVPALPRPGKVVVHPHTLAASIVVVCLLHPRERRTRAPVLTGVRGRRPGVWLRRAGRGICAYRGGVIPYSPRPLCVRVCVLPLVSPLKWQLGPLNYGIIPPPSVGGLDLNSSDSGCARLGSGATPSRGGLKKKWPS